MRPQRHLRLQCQKRRHTQLPDVVSPAVRSRMMSGIRGKDTKPELTMRTGLHALGYRYRLHDRALPGKPDIVFQGRKALIFVHGCFWHHHDCHLFKWPKSRPDFWREKITANQVNDEKHIASLREAGWRVLVVWECALKGKTRLPVGDPVIQASNWLESGSVFLEIRGAD